MRGPYSPASLRNSITPSASGLEECLVNVTKKTALGEAAEKSVYDWLLIGVGVEGFEPPASCSQSRRATKLRYTPER